MNEQLRRKRTQAKAKEYRDMYTRCNNKRKQYYFWLEQSLYLYEAADAIHNELVGLLGNALRDGK